MFFAFLSARLRRWLLFALVLPVAGRLLQALGVRVGARNARAGEVFTRAGGYARTPMTRRQRRRAARR